MDGKENRLEAINKDTYILSNDRYIKNRLLEVSTSDKRITFDSDNRFGETVSINGMLYTIQDLILDKLLNHDCTSTTVYHVKWSQPKSEAMSGLIY